MTRPLVATSTKAYFSAAKTRAWVAEVAELAGEAAGLGVELAVLPSFPLLESTLTALAGTGVSVGAQAVAASDEGAQTGEVTASLLAELGVRYVEIGHAERRARFGETDEVVRAKCAAAARAGLVPLLCVGEPERGSADAAAAVCIAQMRDALEGVAGEVVVAYEPVWAIGADSPAPAEHVTAVGRGLQAALAGRAAPGRVIYGGTAGPGLAAQLGDSVDGLFLGRRAHDVRALAEVLREVGALAR